jgi:Domain of unknown function (DUF5134)
VLLALLAVGLITTILLGYGMWWRRRPTRGGLPSAPRRGALTAAPVRTSPIELCEPGYSGNLRGRNRDLFPEGKGEDDGMGPMPGPPMPQHMDSMMPMLPGWVRLVWVLALAVVAVIHIWHSATMAGQSRWWHGAHTLMAVGMLAMYGPDLLRQRVLDHALVVVFAVVTAVIAAGTASVGRREGRLNPLWAATGVQTAAMIYMAVVMASPSTLPAALTWIVVAYLGCETLAWLLGLWDRVLARRRASLGLSGPNGVDIRVTLALMAASMAYMLAAVAT